MIAQSEKTNVDYNDGRFFLVFIPLVNLLNYYLTYSNIRFNSHTFITFAIDTMQGFMAWLLIRAIIKYLDRRLPYQPSPGKRIFIQVLLTSSAGLAIIILSTEILNAIVKDTPVPSNFYRFDIFIFLIWFFVINGIYVALYYYSQWKTSESSRQKEMVINGQKKTAEQGIIVKQGKQSLSIPVTLIAAVYVEGEYSMLLTTALKKHLHDVSLEKLATLLPPDAFFRINRQIILHRQWVTGFERLENGKILVLVSNPDQIPVPLQISRTKASAFKAWFNVP